MADAQLSEFRTADYGSGEYVEIAGIVVPGASGPVTVKGDSSGNLIVVGNVAADAVDSGNPVKIGGVANDTPLTPVADNDRVNAWFSRYGEMSVFAGRDAGGSADAFSDASVIHLASNGGGQGILLGGGHVFNGTSWDRMRGNTAGLFAQGNVAADAVDSGNPIKIGGLAGASAPTVADGDRVNAWFDNIGQLAVFTGYASNGGDALSNTQLISLSTVNQDTNVALRIAGMVYNGSTWDRMRGDATNGTDVDVTRMAPLVAGTANIGDVDVLTLPNVTLAAGTNTNEVVGDIAHDGVAAGNPLLIGAYASAAAPTNVSADADVTRLWALRSGALATVLTAAGALIGGDATNGLDVDVTRMSALVAGTANIGDVDIVGGTLASDAVLTTNPVTIGGRASTAAPAAVSADGDVVDARFLRTGALTVHMVDAAGAAASLGTQYVGDAAATATPTGTMAVGLANAAAPTDVSANNDAVAAWHLRNGAAATVITAAGALVGGDATNGLDVDVTRLPALVAGTANIGDVDVLTVPAPLSTTGGGTEATALRVTVATDSTGVLSVDDNGASLTVDGTVAATQSGTWTAVGPTASDAALTASPQTIGGRASTAVPTPVSADGDVVDARFLRNGAAVVHVVDSAGAAQTFGGGTQYVEDVAFGGNGTGTLMIARRDDALSALTPVEDDAVGLRLNSLGALWVDAGLIAHDAVDSGNPIKIGAKANDSAPTQVANADRVDIRATRRGEQLVALVNPTDGGFGGMNANGALIVNLTTSTGTDILQGNFNDGVSAASSGVPTKTFPYLWNGSNFDRPRNLPAFDTAAASPGRLGMAAVVQPDQRFTSVALGTVIGNTQVWDVNGADSVMVHLATTQTGTMTFDVTADGTNWVPAEVRDTQTDMWVSGTSFAPTANKTYRVVSNGWRSVRARTVATLNGTCALTATVAARSTVMNAIDSGPAPHAIGYAVTGKTAQYTSTQTGVALWTPASGKRLIITSYQIQAGGTTAGTMQLWFGASGDTTYTRGTDLAIFDGEFAPSATLKPGVVQSAALGAWQASAVDHILRVTESANINPLTVTVWGYEL